jgi:hypothetical protein
MYSKRAASDDWPNSAGSGPKDAGGVPKWFVVVGVSAESGEQTGNPVRQRARRSHLPLKALRLLREAGGQPW